MDTQKADRPTTPPRRPLEPETTAPPKTRRIDTDSDKFAQQRDAKAEAPTLSEGTQDLDANHAHREAARPKEFKPQVPPPRTPLDAAQRPARELREFHTIADLAD